MDARRRGERRPQLLVRGRDPSSGWEADHHPAHVIWRDIEGTKPSWWPGITIPAKKQISYGPTFQDEYPYKTDLHATKIVKGSVFSVTAKDGAVTRYRIEKVETLAG